LAAILLNLFVNTAWARYMDQCAELCAKLAAGSAPGANRAWPQARAARGLRVRGRP
jgi:hypothetical protein